MSISKRLDDMLSFSNFYSVLDHGIDEEVRFWEVEGPGSVYQINHPGFLCQFDDNEGFITGLLKPSIDEFMRSRKK